MMLINILISDERIAKRHPEPFDMLRVNCVKDLVTVIANCSEAIQKRPWIATVGMERQTFHGLPRNDDITGFFPKFIPNRRVSE